MGAGCPGASGGLQFKGRRAGCYLIRLGMFLIVWNQMKKQLSKLNLPSKRRYVKNRSITLISVVCVNNRSRHMF